MTDRAREPEPSELGARLAADASARPSLLLATVALLVTLTTLLALLTAGQAFGSGVTNSGDDLRDGWYPDEPSLTPQLVSGGTFGQLWSTTVDGQVYAQPLLANGTLLVATENDKVYGLDPATGAMRWPAPLDLGPAWKAADIGCGDLTPNIGVTATPVIDAATNTAYLTHKTYASGTSGTARWFMDAIDMKTGTEKAGFPVQLSGTAQNHPTMTFQPTTELQRPGLLLMNGVVYAAFGSHCDFTPWQGWVFGVSTSGEVKARWVALPSGNGAGIWQSGAGLTSDGPGSLMIATGNGGAPSTPTPGSSPPGNLAESIVRLAVQGDGSLKAVDFFAPFDAGQLDEWDADFASGGVTGLNDEFFGTPSVPHLAVAVGKDGYVYLLNRAELGGLKQGVGGGDKVVQRIGPYGGVWSRPGVWPGDGGWVYIPTASGGTSGSGSSGFFRVYQYGVSGTGQPTLSLQATSPDAFGFTSSAPVITSDGTNSGSALVWIVWTPNRTGEGAQLRAYDPIPVEGKPVLRWSAPVGTSAKFALPGVGAGRLYVGTRDGKVLGFGSPVTPLLTGPATNFPTTTLGQSSHKTLTLTATNAVTVTGLTSSSSQFSVGASTPTLPAQLSAGQTIQIPLTFTPSEAGPIGGTLAAETNQGNVSFAMSGTGQSASAQLTVTPAVVSFGGTTVGGHLSGAATFRNVGGAPLTINAIKLPAAPFGATGVPAVGSTIAPGTSVTVNVTFDPTATGSYSDEISMETTGGNGAIGLSGSAGPPGVLQITSEQNEYGAVEVGKTASRSFTVANTGGTNVTITKSKPPSGGAFEATTSLSEGTTLQPGESVSETVVFKPTTAGAASSTWAINGTDTTGLHEVAFTGTGTVPASATFGKTSIGAATDVFAADRKRVNRYALGAAGSVTKLSVYLAPSGIAGQQPLKGEIYADSAGAPGALLGVTEELIFKSTNAAGWYDLPLGSPLKLSAGNYWIGIISGNTGKVAGYRYDNVSGARDYNANVYTAGPSNPFGAVTTDTEQTSLYATYAPGTVAVPVNNGVPTITGTVQQGQTLTEHNGSWTNQPTGFAYQWLQCDALATSCLPIAGAASQTYKLVSSDVGHTIEVQEIASNAAGPGSAATSAATAQVPNPPPPANIALPTITGTSQQGQTLSEHDGSWSNEPTTFEYQWQRCDQAGANCSPTGVKAQTYPLGSGDVGATLRVAVIASNAGGASAAVSSAQTAVVQQAAPATFGKTTVGAATDVFAADRKRVNRYALAAPGSLTKLSVYLAPSGISGQQLLKGVIYADSGGAPAALLGVTEQLTFKSTNASGWYDLVLATPLKLAAGNYWIGVFSGATEKVAGYRYDSVASSRDYNANTYSSGASNPFGAVTKDAEQTSLYATYTPG
jgi:iron transport multicopper oxidase